MKPFGLTRTFPEDWYDDGVDGRYIGWVKEPVRERFDSFSAANHDVLRDALVWSRFLGDCVMEIGVSRDKHPSTKTILENLGDRFYLGIDLRQTDVEESTCVHTIRCNSWEHNRIELELTDISGYLPEDLGDPRCRPISLLHIDGCHRTDNVFGDWHFAQYVAIGGFVVLHDTRMFRGPRYLAESIDPKYFEVQMLFNDKEDDWGLTLARRIK